ncbi:hypothetical protein T439DRAFT_350124 [Meredithblackwellia eburnea MCA 4105]
MAAKGHTLETLLVTFPIESAYPEILQRLQQVFKKVYFYPGEDGTGIEPEEYGPPKLPPAQVFAEADVILAFVVPSNLTHISQTPRLKLWQVLGSGTDLVVNSDFWRSIPKDHPLLLSNVAGIHAVPIAEHVIMTTLMHFHKMEKCISASREGRWASAAEMGGLFIREMRGLTLGIIAYGQIAREIARLATAFGCRVLACTRDGQARQLLGGFSEEGTGDPQGLIPQKYFCTTEKAEVHAFLSECDVVVNMMPSTPHTKQFIGREELKAMKDDALLVNAGRGDTVDTEALVQALMSKESRTGATGTLIIGGAALDVTSPEPLSQGHILFTLSNAIITPHCSWASEKIYDRVVDIVQENKKRVEAGDSIVNSLR